jgi:Tripartite tricarboxylate transporter family receptor
MPDILTVDEAGLPGLYIPMWHGLWAPKGTPKDVTAKLSGAILESIADPAGPRESRLAPPGHSRTRATDGGGFARLPRGDQAVYAADQGGRDQDRIEDGLVG